jgi:hypothetical protein
MLLVDRLMVPSAAAFLHDDDTRGSSDADMDRAHVACDEVVWDMYFSILFDESGHHPSTCAAGLFQRRNTNATVS